MPRCRARGKLVGLYAQEDGSCPSASRGRGRRRSTRRSPTLCCHRTSPRRYMTPTVSPPGQFLAHKAKGQLHIWRRSWRLTVGRLPACGNCYLPRECRFCGPDRDPVPCNCPPTASGTAFCASWVSLASSLSPKTAPSTEIPHSCTHIVFCKLRGVVHVYSSGRPEPSSSQGALSPQKHLPIRRVRRTRPMAPSRCSCPVGQLVS